MQFFFFFSSRRRHTRSTRDWSSDVCSSDLHLRRYFGGCATKCIGGDARQAYLARQFHRPLVRWDRERRSEERRVGKSVDLGGRRIIKKKKKKKTHKQQQST